MRDFVVVALLTMLALCLMAAWRALAAVITFMLMAFTAVQW